ncbi:Protein timeless homolog [Eumeta japonica]|uniref:Protein timeless homolog n=1 Tax=Eumeta variegata TaxID=151549 RepID=A0A4C1U0B1_EUMVA|nr:Protein timeless homolog [Eumeta japonica]
MRKGVDWNERDEDTGLIIERILILILNVLHVPADLDKECKPENDASVHDQVLWALNSSGILDIIFYMSSENEKQYFMHILEIISHLLREQNPTSLSDSELHRSIDEKLRDEQELLKIRNKEMKQKSEKVKQYSFARHSRFGGTYVIQNMKSISENEMVCLKPLNNVADLDFGGKKDKFIKSKNRRPTETGTMERRSPFAVRAKAQQNDESYYLGAVKFFMEFNRGHDFNIGLVSETMSVSMFHYVQQQMEKYYDMIKVEKKKFATWVRRLHLALRTYKELLNTLLAMDKSPDLSVKESAKYYEIIFVEHQTKVNKSQPVQNVERPAWEEVRPQLAMVLNSQIDEHPPPFDAASDIPIDEQKEYCIKNIQKLMATFKLEESVGMFRAAREVWPEGGIFGEDGIPAEDELIMLETIYTTDLGVQIENVNSTNNETDEVSEDESDEEEEEEEKTSAVIETDFDFKDFVSRFCVPRIVSACVFLLESYDRNSTELNHCVAKILHRIAWDCKRPSMLFQASLFLIFQKILHNPSPEYKELEKLAIFIFRKFTEIASANPKTFIELLFWKNVKDSNQIELGYDIYNDAKPGKGIWSEEQEEELRNLYMENQQNPATDKDVIDWIMENLIDQTRTRRSVIKKLKDLGLIFRAPTKKSNTREKVPLEFSEEEDEKLKELWEQFSETIDPMNAVIARMPRKRPKKSFVERLLQLGIIKDKKECRKKKLKKSGQKIDTEEKSSDSESSSDTDSDIDCDINSTALKIKISRQKTVDSSKGTAINKSKYQKDNLTASQIGKLLIEAVQKDLSEALKWIAENLEEVALDQQAEGFEPEAEGIPLVPISSNCAEAMENEIFQKIIKGIGIHPPDNEQESYWRIPASLHFETLRKKREIILKALEGTLVVDDNPNNEEKLDNNKDIPTEGIQNVGVTNDGASSEDDNSLFENLRKIRETSAQAYKKKSLTNKNRKRSRSTDSEENIDCFKKLQRTNIDNNLSDDEDILSFAKKTILNGRDLPDTEDILSGLPKDDDSGREDSDNQDVISSNTKKKRRVIIDDDSD